MEKRSVLTQNFVDKHVPLVYFELSNFWFESALLFLFYLLNLLKSIELLLFQINNCLKSFNHFGFFRLLLFWRFEWSVEVKQLVTVPNR